MRVIAVVLPLVLVTAPALVGQVDGDSVRFRVNPWFWKRVRLKAGT